MLPSRLFRNTGIPPPLRALITPHPSLPSSIAVQLRLRLAVRPDSILGAGQRLAQYSTPAVAEPQAESQKVSTQAAIAPRLSLTFTCTANDCGERSTHEFSKQAYESGIVLVQCPKCDVRHLIADHIGWFKESTEDGTLRTVEDLLRARGEKVTRGTVEYTPP
ncbi:DNL-type domain-containing protein [Mycena indigotica]|uniref:DNL-type domain-containing protein n=1 Tax=Mycena indigotica TaxID=2126181 RepID=A0A8H6T4Z8_9AGAR|nr:DNL-type domain-containing protein [Mycena indigotica]KAF7309520.1 DNL-type domain-containing protein [Mycena indigotica]